MTTAQSSYIDARARAEFWRLAAAVFLVSFLVAHSTLLSIVFTNAGMSLREIGWLLSLPAIPIMAATVLSGAIMARIGALATTRMGMAAVIVGLGSLQWTRHDFGLALASRMVQGVGLGVLLAACITYGQSRLRPVRFVYLLGILSSMFPLAAAFAPAFGGWVLQTYGDGDLFLIASVPAIIGFALTIGLRPLARPKDAHGLDLADGLRRDRIAPLAAVFACGTMFAFNGSYLAAALQGRGIAIAAFFTSATLAMFVTRFLILRRASALDRRLTTAGGLTLMSIGLFSAAAPAGTALVVAGGIAFGMGHSVIYPLLTVWMSEGLAPERRGGPQAVLNTAFNAGIYITPFPQTLLLEAYGYDMTQRLVACVGVAMAAWLVAAWVRR